MTSHTGFSPPTESPATTSTMISDISMSNIQPAGTVSAVPFQIIGARQERYTRSRSTTPGRNSARGANSPDQRMTVNMDVQQNNDIHQQLLSMQQQVSNILTVNQPVAVTNQVLQVFQSDNQAEVEALRNIADTAVLHAQVTTAQAHQAVAAMQQQTAETV